MSVLITGAAGLIGRNLVAALEQEREVVAVSRSAAPTGRARNVIADLASSQFTDALPAQVETVVHLAQSPHYRDFPNRADDIFAVNVASTARLLDWARKAGAKRFILASAGGADGGNAGSPLSFYLAGKRAAELLAQSYSADMTVTVLRFFFVYGRGQKRSMLIPRLVDSVRDGKAITLAGRDGMRLNPVHVADAVRAVSVAASTDQQGTFDIAGPQVLSLREIGDAIGRRLGVAPQFDVAGPAGADLVGDTRAMASRLAAPVRRFEEAVEDVL